MAEDYFDIYRSGIYGSDDDLLILKHYSGFDGKSRKRVNFSYQAASNVNLEALRMKYKLEDIAGKHSSDLEQISNIRKWISSIFARKGTVKVFNTLRACENETFSWNAETILQQSTNEEFQADCATYATVLTETLLALGYKAKWIQCLPIDLRHIESHCITHVYVPSLQKWIIADAAQDLFYFNKKGIPMNLYEFRNALINDERVFIFSTNEKKHGRDALLDYWKKNIFRFRCFSDNEFGFLTKSEQKNYYLDPVGYSITDKYLSSGRQKIHIHTQCAEDFFEM